MIRSISLSIGLFLAFYIPAIAQTPQRSAADEEFLAYIARDVYRTAQSVEKLSAAIGEFTKTFSTHQGLQLNDRQRWMLLALEVLNRLETSLANMMKLRLDLVERQSKMRMQLATVTDDLLPESIDRYVSTRGSLDAERLREIRRSALTREQRELTAVLRQVENELAQTTTDITRTEQQVRSIRSQVFGEIERQLAQ